MEDFPCDWDPMTEDANSCSNNYHYDPTDIGNVVQGYKSRDYTGICFHFLKGHCKFGAGCLDKHISPEQLEKLDSEEVLIETLEKDIITVGAKLKVTVTYCMSPHSFYVVPAEDIINRRSNDSRVGRNYDFVDPTAKNLSKMTREMSEFYRNPANGENMMIFPAIGSLVAVRSGTFYRARVIDMHPDEDYLTVMNIDSGVELLVERRQVFTLKPKFAVLPAFAIHCGIEMPPVPVTDQVKNNFSHSIIGKIFSAHFKERDMTERFQVDLFDSSGRKITI